MGDAYKSNLCLRLLLPRISVPSVHVNTLFINTYSSPVFATTEACGSIWMTMWSVTTVGIRPQKTHSLSTRNSSTTVSLKFGHRKIRHIYIATKANYGWDPWPYFTGQANALLCPTRSCYAPCFLESTGILASMFQWRCDEHGPMACTVSGPLLLRPSLVWSTATKKFIIKSFTHMPIWMRTSTHKLQSFRGGNSNP